MHRTFALQHASGFVSGGSLFLEDGTPHRNNSIIAAPFWAGFYGESKKRPGKNTISIAAFLAGRDCAKTAPQGAN